MAEKYIRKPDAVDALADYIMNVDKVYSTGKLTRDDCTDCAESVLDDLSSADAVPYSIDPDGTLTITVPKGTKRIGRILIEEDGTRYGGLFYPDTGGCFLSSMEGT